MASEELGTCELSKTVPHTKSECCNSTWQPLTASVTGDPETPAQDQRMFTDEECLPEYFKSDLEEDQQAEIDRLREALEELVDLMEEVRAGGYKPDSFTCQPARAALAPRKANQDKALFRPDPTDLLAESASLRTQLATMSTHVEEARKRSAEFMYQPEPTLPITAEAWKTYMEYGGPTCECYWCAHCRMVLTLIERAGVAETQLAEMTALAAARLDVIKGLEESDKTLRKGLEIAVADVVDLREALDGIRDAVLNERGPLAKMNTGNDIINAVLGIIDDHTPALAKQEVSRAPPTPKE
jgi:hypothetical protein